MNQTVVSCLVVLALILIEALFVASEIALVSLREAQVQELAESGRRGAVVARLVRDPNRFLATVQIGVTLTALLSSAYGATTLSEDAKRALVSAGMSSGLAGFVGLVGVTMIISFVTLVIGELAPKRLAMQRIEPTARAVAPFLNGMSRLCRPVIWLLSVCTDGVVRLFGGDPSAAREQVSEAELRRMVASNDSLSKDERRLIDEVFGAGERQLREVLVPRTEVIFLEGATSIPAAAAEIAGHPHSRYPVIDQSADNVVGFVHVRDLLSPSAPDRGENVAALARPALFLPSTKHVLDALSEMRRDSFHLAIVVDEYGGTAGIVTLEDLVEEVIGDIRDEYDNARADVIRLRGGGLDLSGLVNLDEAAEEIGVRLPEGPYETLAGFLIAQLGRLPQTGDEVFYDGLRFTVHTMDGRRVSRVWIVEAGDEATRAAAEAAADAEAAAEAADAAAQADRDGDRAGEDRSGEHRSGPHRPGEHRPGEHRPGDSEAGAQTTAIAQQ